MCFKEQIYLKGGKGIVKELYRERGGVGGGVDANTSLLF